MTRIADMLERMQQAGMPLERGTPATDPEVAALQSSAGGCLPPEYLAFLKEFGALRAGRCVVFGTGPQGLSVEAARAEVEQEFAVWDRTVADATPVLAKTNHFPQECLVLDAAGRLQSFYRGELDALKAGFEDKAVAWLANELDQHLEEARAKDLRDRVMAAIRSHLPDELHTDEGVGGSFVVRRPGDGSRIEIRFGNGREYWHKAPGVFVHWTQPSSKSPEAMNAFNRRARFVRGCIQEGCDRYRGLLPADASIARALVSALAHDAGLPNAIEVNGEPSLDEIAAALPPSPVPPEQMLLLAVLGRDGEAPEFEREGDSLLLSAPSLVHAGVRHAVRIRSKGQGLVEVTHVPGAALAWPEINALNGAAVKDGDPNRDDESMLRAVEDGASTVLSFVTTLTGLTNGAYLHDLASLVRLADRGLAA